MTRRNAWVAALFAAGCVAGWWVTRRRGVADVAARLEGLGEWPVPDLFDQDDDDEEAAVVAVGDVKYTGTCGEDRRFGEPPAGCGEGFAIASASIVVVRWLDADVRDEWQVLGYCPDCGYLAVSHTCDYPSAKELIVDGAGVIVVERPAELDEKIRKRRVHNPSDATIERVVFDASCLLADDDGLAEAVALLVKRYGRRM